MYNFMIRYTLMSLYGNFVSCEDLKLIVRKFISELWSFTPGLQFQKESTRLANAYSVGSQQQKQIHTMRRIYSRCCAVCVKYLCQNTLLSACSNKDNRDVKM